ncbi:D-tagatose-bisphosphate aldolase, class II, non-catalytic subunit [Rhizobium sp. AC44/96]|uniref:D-tagatose-bisphosphate aldolase, class II, non-catalytic subunit n=1 Tax=unclassified Rhizobium TaxID=2613769 RepID=UPI00080F812F|nr:MULTISPECIES: D-tagatose-bisphosphate aldolase, class II, non-catalytic subunit [unclassified Rhizobium]MDM9620431.1 D-tagatose-bisphosphate aldolase, class II, non-catalytic subunit [Rhizobium sp. S96]OCJ09082.1 D-tagatose-bisphosphate aldolase, class II, non-catalytic subunit [Rhizobium sp. AC44/96]
MQQSYLSDIASWRQRAGSKGIPSICSAHPVVIEASMLHALRRGEYLLVEATCNQVNQDGGYTGMTPADFRAFVEKIAAKTGFPLEKLILGGDHLGPNPWKSLPASEAMEKAKVMIKAYAEAGFTKLHLDTSMGCAGEPVALPDVLTAERAASLAAVAEAALDGSAGIKPVYIVGTEVPIPGGAMEELEVLEVTKPDAARETIAVHRKAFEAAGVGSAFSRVVAAVVQPGVEFGNENVIAYEPEAARALSATLSDVPGLVFEAHSTDYQTQAALRQLVLDGFAILKVGPGLTFALREALYGLDQIAAFLFPGKRKETLVSIIERVLTQEPGNWQKYYHGSMDEQHLQRHFSYSDRIRYYWPHPEINAAVSELLAILEGVEIPETLISQYLQGNYPAVRDGRVKPQAQDLALAAVDRVLDDYFTACRA